METNASCLPSLMPYRLALPSRCSPCQLGSPPGDDRLPFVVPFKLRAMISLCPGRMIGMQARRVLVAEGQSLDDVVVVEERASAGGLGTAEASRVV